MVVVSASAGLGTTLVEKRKHKQSKEGQEPGLSELGKVQHPIPNLITHICTLTNPIFLQCFMNPES